MESGEVTTDVNDYVEASEEIIYDDSLDLIDTMRETQITFNLFLNNRFELAEERMKTLADRSIYHAAGLNTIRLIKATMTCEKARANLKLSALVTLFDLMFIRESVVLQLAENKISSGRRQKWTVTETLYSMGEWTKAKAIAATDEEIHSELCYAETILFRAVLSFFQDESLSSFVRGALRIRTCHSIYKACYKILEYPEVWEHRDIRIKQQFESGVRLGVGCFNLMISCLPPKILRLLQVVGFSGDKQRGMDELDLCISLDHTLRSDMGRMTVLTWHLIACYFLGLGEPDLNKVHTLLAPFSQKFPRGSLILFFRARLCLVTGRIEESIKYYNGSINSQDSYRQFHHGCFWELIFAHAFLREWHIAAAYARRLAKESKWSRTVYLYYLSILISADNSVDSLKRDEAVQALLMKVDRYRSRIAGKSIPMEKFCSRRALRGLRVSSMAFAHYEFLYFWNGFDIIGSNPDLMEPILNDLIKTWKEFKPRADVNDACLFRFLRGVILRHLGRLEEAEKCFNDVIEREAQLTDLSYLIPNAFYELGVLKHAQVYPMESESCYNTALKYRSYSLENKLHFRLHGAMDKLTRERPLLIQMRASLDGKL